MSIKETMAAFIMDRLFDLIILRVSGVRTWDGNTSVITLNNILFCLNYINILQSKLFVFLYEISYSAMTYMNISNIEKQTHTNRK